MAYSYNLYTGNGSTTQYPVAFGYIRREHVLATVAGTPVTFAWVNDSLIQMDATPANGAAIRVYRTTPIDAPLVDFADGATLVASDLDTNARQLVYTQQEMSDSIIEGSVGAIPNGDRGDITTSVGGTVWTIDNGAVTSSKIASNTIVNSNVSTSAAIASSKISFTQSGTGAATRTIESRLKDVVSVKDFGAVGDGSTNDTTAIQAAIDYANTNGKLLVFPTATYAVTTLTTYSYTKIDGQNSTLAQLSGTSPLINHTSTIYALQTCERCVISDLLLFRNTLTTSTVGFYSTSPTLVLSNVRAEGFDVGFKLETSQFGTFYSAKTYRCNVGLYLISTAAGDPVGNGGGNSYSFYDYQASQCKVGILLSNEGTFPHHSIYFRNPSVLGCSVCGVATFGTSNVVFDGGAGETNGDIPSTYTFDGLTIKSASYYFKSSLVSLINTYIAEATVSPAIICETSTVLTLSEVYGYGVIFSAGCITCDSTSYVVNAGSTNLQSSVGASVSGTTMGNTPPAATLQLGPPIVYETTNLPNTCASPAGGDLADTNGTTSSGYAQDSTYGFYSYAVFGTSGAGRMRFIVPVAADNDLSIVSFSVKASVNTTLDCRFTDTTTGATSTNLFAGRWYRVTWAVSNALISNSGLRLGTNTTGVQLDVCKFQQFTGSPTNSNTISVLNAMLAGAYNPKIKALKQFYEVTAAPSIGTWAKGDIVYHSAPAASGNIGWVCTTAGSPGTWKTFGAISA
jgi:hypothetical protein